ncbi:MAG TPA: hypothetical protein VME43_00375 [Bryobacteraceae bacterium]|nr:hypothetical protein [Bryobacteraceae bacterium]
MIRSAVKLFLSVCLTAGVASVVWASDPPASPETPPAAAPTAVDIAKLKAKLEEQQKQVEKLKAELEEQLKMLEQAGAAAPAAPAASTSAPAAVSASATPAAPAPTAASGTPQKKPYVGSLTASTVPFVQPAPPADSSPFATPAPRSTASLQGPAGEPASPLQLKIGETTITPIGFMDMTEVFRSADSGSGIGTNFGSIVYNNNFPNARLTESRFNIQNSRIGARFDTTVHGAKITGYWESDFLGGSSSNALSVTNNAFVLRARLYWVDVRKDKFEFLAGQSWSLMTPGRNGISPLPGDVFYTQDMDVNYNAGLVWGRIPGFRFVYHPSDTVAMAVSVENADQYFGGSGGGASPTLPSGLPSTFVNQLDNASNYSQTPNLIPDIIAKIAFDPKTGPLHQHIEIAGVYSEFKTYNQLTNNHYTSPAAGGSVNMNFEVAKNFHPIINTFWSDGEGRYMFGTIPDLAIRPDGSISPIHTWATLDGFEATFKNSLLFGYFGIYYGGQDSIVDTNGKFVGYGFPGSANSNNRIMQEPTFGWIQTLWKDPRWGALQTIFQYSWINRYPWAVLAGQPKDAHNSTIFLDVRYTLPGSAPSWH